MASILKVDQIQESTTGVGTNFSTTGSATTPTISIGNQTNKGFYHEGTDKIGISVNSGKVGEINSNGVLNGTLGTEYRNILQYINNNTVGQNNGTTTALYNNTFASINNGVNRLLAQGFITPKNSNSIIIVKAISPVTGTSATDHDVQSYLYEHTTSQGNINTNITITGTSRIQLSNSSGRAIAYGYFVSWGGEGIYIKSGHSIGIPIWFSIIGRCTFGSGAYLNSNTGTYLEMIEVI